MKADPHAGLPILVTGTPVKEAMGAIILLHGRGGSAEEMLGLARDITPPACAMLAPQAAGHSWYPYSFLASREQNEPYLTSAMRQVQAALDMALAAGLSVEKAVVCGFSQGACLATEFVGRNPQRYAALVAFTGGLIGPIEVPLVLSGDLANTPALLSSGDPDPHVPWARVQESAELLQGIGGSVTLRRYPGKPHSISLEELDLAREMLKGWLGDEEPTRAG